MKYFVMRTTLVGLLACSTNLLYAQYFSEQVMEKSFEQTDFFFMPYHLVPFGIGTFRNSVTGLVNDPILNLEMNPAFLFSDSARSGHLYVDFRSSREIADHSQIYYPYPVLYAAYDIANRITYPGFFVNTRRAIEPVISAAYLFRPVSGPLHGLSLGLTYQAISQDEKYYQIPQDIYRSALGYDYKGVRTSVADDIPIVDKYNGTDKIHHKGDFVSFFAGYEIDPDLTVGLKVGRVSFDRDGAFGSQNFWQSPYAAGGTSLWRDNEARNQAYRHWELIGGAEYRVTPQVGVNITGGHLWGTADQNLLRADSSYYAYGPILTPSGNWSYNMHSGMQTQIWNHDGKTSLGGAGIRAQVTPKHLLQFHYLYTHQGIDLGLHGRIADTSSGGYRSSWDTTVYNGVSTSRVYDRRDGTGTTSGNDHRLIGSLQWDISPTIRVYLGAQYETRETKTTTSEFVVADRFSRYVTTGSYPSMYFDSTAEAKTLQWDFRTKLSQLTIPVIFTMDVSERVQLMFGLNRTMSEWEVNDVTLALFDYRETNGTLQQRFGERYTQPQEKVSEVKTAVLAGLTVAPSAAFNIRLLVVPNFVDSFNGTELQDLQAWIAVNVTP